MYYLDCINIYVGCILYLLERNWTFKIPENLNEYSIKLDKEGILVYETNKFNTVPILENGYTQVSPEFIIATILNTTNGFSTNNIRYNNVSIDSLAKNLPVNDIYNEIPFIEIMELLNSIHNNFYLYEKKSNINDISYFKLINLLNNLGTPETSGILSELINLKKLPYEKIATLKESKPELARKLERIYKINTLLLDYVKSYMLKINYKEKNNIDIEEYEWEWNEFLDCISYFNSLEKDKQTQKWLKQEMTNRLDDMFATTELGLKNITCPSSLYEIKALKLLKKNN